MLELIGDPMLSLIVRGILEIIVAIYLLGVILLAILFTYQMIHSRSMDGLGRMILATVFWPITIFILSKTDIG